MVDSHNRIISVWISEHLNRIVYQHQVTNMGYSVPCNRHFPSYEKNSLLRSLCMIHHWLKYGPMAHEHMFRIYHFLIQGLIFILCECFCLHVCICTLCLVLVETRRGYQIRWNWSYRWYKPACGCWGLDPGPPQEQQKLLATEPSLWPQNLSLLPAVCSEILSRS